MSNGNPTPSILTPADRRGISAEACNKSESYSYGEIHTPGYQC